MKADQRFLNSIRLLLDSSKQLANCGTVALDIKNETGPRMKQTMMKLIAVATILISSASCAQSDADANPANAHAAQTVLITGANRGIGLELARQYAAAGWQVIGTARNPDSADELRSLEIQILQLDVTDQESVDRLADALGNHSIDVLINNAGILPMAVSITDIDMDAFNRTLAVNTVGPVRVTRALLPYLRQGTLKKIINVSSNLGSLANNTEGRFYGYRESKAALNMFTRSLAAELRTEQFICISLHPGWVQTDMGGANATLTVQDSVSGIREVVEGLKPADNGTFWSHDGTQLPW